jgi:hypothetical protein
MDEMNHQEVNLSLGFEKMSWYWETKTESSTELENYLSSGRWAGMGPTSTMGKMSNRLKGIAWISITGSSRGAVTLTGLDDTRKVRDASEEYMGDSRKDKG